MASTGIPACLTQSGREPVCGLAKNRTWIWSFGNSYTIHCTTRPFIFYFIISELSYYPRPNASPKDHSGGVFSRAGIVLRGHLFYILNCAILLPNILTAMAINITPKNFLITINPLGPKTLSTHFKDFNTIKIIAQLINIPTRILMS